MGVFWGWSVVDLGGLLGLLLDGLFLFFYLCGYCGYLWGWCYWVVVGYGLDVFVFWKFGYVYEWGVCFLEGEEFVVLVLFFVLDFL